MAINTLGLTQGLNAAAEGLQSGYMNALGTIYQRNLAQQKQTSESALQNAQAGYFSGRNASQQSVATIRANAVNEAGQTRANGALEVARVNALQKLPGSFNTLAAQDPAAAGDYLKSVDAMNGGQTSFFKDLFPNRYAAEQSASGQGAAGGPGQPYTDPTDGSIKFGAPSSAPALPALPLPGPAGSPLSSGVQGVSPMSFSAPGVGLSGMGLNAPPASSITGVSSALPPPSGPIGASSLGNTPAAPAPSLGSGTLPTLPPPSGPVGNQPPAPASSGAVMPSLPPSGPIGASQPVATDANPFKLSPLTVSRINKNNAGANGTLSKTDMAFQNSVGLLPPAQQAQATARFNQINGTNYAVPGTQTFPTLANGTPVLGPPTLTPSYVPNTLQAATIAAKKAQAGLDNSLGTAATGGLQVKQMTAHQQAAYQASLIALKRQGLTDDEARAQTDEIYKLGMLGVAKENAGTAQQRLQQGGNGVAGDALTARLNERMTTLTMPGRPDLFGKPTAPLVTLDAQGNPSGPGAHEYHQLQSMLRGGSSGGAAPVNPLGGAAPVNPLGGGYHLIPGVGNSVRGVSGPSVPPLPGFPLTLPGASRAGANGGGASDMITINGRTATRAQWAAEMAKPGRR